jgi:hypothetical protein
MKLDKSVNYNNSILLIGHLTEPETSFRTFPLDGANMTIPIPVPCLGILSSLNSSAQIEDNSTSPCKFNGLFVHKVKLTNNNYFTGIFLDYYVF